MFFIGYALKLLISQIWCGHATKDALVKKILTDQHSPNPYRVNLVLANQPEFAEAFNCAVGTPMNPRERCSVW
ncbi:unnamed protein product [Haemonchus placei]|uniref:Peptidase_M13 domain-containing protein n=1 Tax=Haemonchus placei TaxID=6290 RepID=A0A0N4W5H9_HAEPC|nr:unnamed protein product [Haemonchus placei]